MRMTPPTSKTMVQLAVVGADANEARRRYSLVFGDVIDRAAATAGRVFAKAFRAGEGGKLAAKVGIKARQQGARAMSARKKEMGFIHNGMKVFGVYSAKYVKYPV